MKLRHQKPLNCYKHQLNFESSEESDGDFIKKKTNNKRGRPPKINPEQSELKYYAQILNKFVNSINQDFLQKAMEFQKIIGTKQAENKTKCIQIQRSNDGSEEQIIVLSKQNSQISEKKKIKEETKENSLAQLNNTNQLKVNKKKLKDKSLKQEKQKTEKNIDQKSVILKTKEVKSRKPDQASKQPKKQMPATSSYYSVGYPRYFYSREPNLLNSNYYSTIQQLQWKMIMRNEMRFNNFVDSSEMKQLMHWPMMGNPYINANIFPSYLTTNSNMLMKDELNTNVQLRKSLSKCSSRQADICYRIFLQKMNKGSLQQKNRKFTKNILKNIQQIDKEYLNTQLKYSQS